MAKMQWKGGALLSPVPPALITCGDMEKPNLLTVAWTGILCTNPPTTYISLRPSRYSHEIISKTGQFTINLTTTDMVRKVDFCGVKSGRDVNKIEEMRLTLEEGKSVACPMLAESPVSLECKVSQVIPLGSHDMFMAEILAVHVDDAYLDEKGKLHLERCGLMAFSHGEYFAMGRKVGHLGFSVRKKGKKPYFSKKPIVKK